MINKNKLDQSKITIAVNPKKENNNIKSTIKINKQNKNKFNDKDEIQVNLENDINDYNPGRTCSIDSVVRYLLDTNE